jgi:hypothetical protein
MKRLLLLTLLALLALALTACQPTEPMTDTRPEDFAVRYRWETGSLPPPYHYEIDLTLGPDDEGRLALQLGYSAEEEPPRIRAFDLPAGALDELYARFGELKLLRGGWQPEKDPPIGGSLEWMEVTAGGKTVELPAFVRGKRGEDAAAAYEAVRALVPEDVWAWVNEQQAEYERAHQD